MIHDSFMRVNEHLYDDDGHYLPDVRSDDKNREIMPS